MVLRLTFPTLAVRVAGFYHSSTGRSEALGGYGEHGHFFFETNAGSVASIVVMTVDRIHGSTVMLDTFIIEELRRRERQQRERERDDRRPRLELPIDERYEPIASDDVDDGARPPERGIVVIDL